MDQSHPPTAKSGIYLYIEGDDSSLTMRESNLILKEDDYNTTILEEGALVPGGAISFLSTDALGLFSQYAAVGFVYGLIPGLGYPVFRQYMDLEGYQVASYGVVVNLGWSLKIFFGMLSDCFPIWGYRRKPWIFFGWAITLTSCLFMALKPIGDPYCNPKGNDTIAQFCLDREYKKVPTNHFNPGTKSEAHVYIVASMFASMGYVMAACASDAMLVQYAQREPLATRGQTQTAIYVIRTMSSILSQLLIAFGLNGYQYGGSFSFSIPVNTVFGILCAPCILVCITTVYWLREDRVERAPFRKWVFQFWQLIQRQAMWQILAFRFLSNFFQNFSSTTITPISSDWAKVEPLVDALSSVLGNIFFSAILVVVGRYGLQWNWRWTIAISTVALILIDACVYMITIWDIVRDQWFYTGVILADQFPTGVRFIVSVFCAVELADLGNEGAVYGLVTTVNNLTSPVSAVFYKFINSFFDVTNDDISKDTTHVRWQVSYTFFIAYGMKLGSLAWLFLLPPQKAHLQRLKRNGMISPLAGGISVFIFVGLLAFSITTNLLSIFQSTACLRIAGGKGCPPSNTTP